MESKGRAELVDIATPQPRKGEVLLKVAYAGICASDLHVIFGDKKTSDQALTLGHECSGTVVQLGEDVTSYLFSEQPIRNGDRVAVDPVIPCMKCRECLRGRYNLCPDMSHLGIFQDGCFAEYVSVPANRCYLLPDQIDDLQASLIEPLACAMNFIDKAKIDSGDLVGIIGGGAIGQMTAKLAAASLGGKVFVSEPSTDKRNKLLQFGVDGVINPTEENAQQQWMELTGGQGCDVVIECVGTSNAVQDAFHYTRLGGTCVLGGLPNGKLELDIAPLVYGEIQVKGVLATSWHFDRAIRLLEKNQIQLHDMADAIVSLEEAESILNQGHTILSSGKTVIRI